MRLDRCVFLDTETGGLRLEQPIIQLAAIAVDTVTWTELEVFDERLRFDVKECDAKALEINHYTVEAWAEAKEPGAVVNAFGAFLNRHVSLPMVSKAGRPFKLARAGGHNIIGFDLERLSRLFKRHGVYMPLAYSNVLDTLHGAAWFFERQPATTARPENLRLQTLREALGVSADMIFDPKPCAQHAVAFCSACGAHTALPDVRTSIALARVFAQRS